MKEAPKLTPRHLNVGYIVLAVILLLLYQSVVDVKQVSRLAYSEFEQHLADDAIAEVVVGVSTIEGYFKRPVDGKSRFATARVEPEFAAQLAEYDVRVVGAPSAGWLAATLSWALPVLLFFALWMFVFRRFADKQGLGGMMSVGKSRAKVYVERSTGVSFDDVAGVDSAKEELMEIVAFLKNSSDYQRLGAHMPKGNLLVGPPGTGKTLLARAVAGEAGVPFFSISGSEFIEMFVGVGAARVRDLFEQASKVAPCIIFIDELDSLGKARSTQGFGGGHDEKEQTLNQLLAELDGFDPREGIVLLAATNRPEILDPALLRAGRFDRQIVVDRPDKRGREAILKVHLEKVRVDPSLDVAAVAAITPGFTGADLASLVNEAAIVATRSSAETLTLDSFTQAVERVVAGAAQPGRIMNLNERERIAWHEMGHALVAASLLTTDPVHKVSIIPRSVGALGYTLQRPTEDRYVITTEELNDRMAVLLAGRAAEQIALGSISTGAADDLAKVTDIARQMVTSFGMSEIVGQAVLEREPTSYLGDKLVGMKRQDYSEKTAREVDTTVRELIDDAYQRARHVLMERRSELDAGVALLLEHETITPDEFAPLRQSTLTQAA